MPDKSIKPEKKKPAKDELLQFELEKIIMKTREQNRALEKLIKEKTNLKLKK